jgi:NADPH:quinone reductase-like Zn-dependent oxidoreductase
MAAAVCRRYGGPQAITLQIVDRPTPGPDDVLVRIRASAVTRADTMMREGTPRFARLILGLRGPRHPVTGTGFAGDVVAVGDKVNRFKIGDAVFGEAVLGHGTNAEYTCIPQTGVLMHKPANLSYAEAAPVCDGPLTAQNFLTDIFALQRGEQILINGAAGSIGTAAVQIAAQRGAIVTAVASRSKHTLLQSLGANCCIDYQVEDFAAGNTRYNVVFDTVGKSTFTQARRVLTKNGVYLSPVLSGRLLIQMLLSKLSSGQQVRFSATGMRDSQILLQHLAKLHHLLSSGALTMVLDKQLPLSKIADAHEYVDTGHKTGSVVLLHP